MPRKKRFLDSVQTWSEAMDALFDREVNTPVVKRSTRNGNMNPLGFPFGIIQQNVLKCGRADFANAYAHSKYGKLTTDDRVLLYCFMNMRGHFHSSRAHFRLSRFLLNSTFWNNTRVLIDIGCGPATSALALADLFPQQNFAYIGVDSAPAMRRRAKRFFTVGKERKLIGANSSLSIKSTWEKLPKKYVPGCTLMFNFAFFFASASLRKRDLRSLANVICNIGERLVDGHVLISYSNSTASVAGENYDLFLKYLGLVPEKVPDVRTVRYRNRRRQGDVKSQKFVRELFELEFH